MEDPRIQKGVFPLNAEKEKGVYWALMRPFRKPAILLISQNGNDKIKSSRPRNLYSPGGRRENSVNAFPFARNLRIYKINAISMNPETRRRQQFPNMTGL